MKARFTKSAVGPEDTKDGVGPVIFFGSRLRQIFATVSLSAGVLATMNTELLWQDFQAPARNEVGAVAKLVDGAASSARAHDDGGLTAAQVSFQDSLAQDEMKDENPFLSLSSNDPLNKILDKGVLSFRREAFRSPNYREESGYDLLSYEITHPDKTVSTILAYLENPGAANGEPQALGGEERATFVMFMVSAGPQTAQYFFRKNTLIERSDLTPAEARAIVSRRLNTGVPFISVSR